MYVLKLSWEMSTGQGRPQTFLNPAPRHITQPTATSSTCGCDGCTRSLRTCTLVLRWASCREAYKCVTLIVPCPHTLPLRGGACRHATGQAVISTATSVTPHAQLVPLSVLARSIVRATIPVVERPTSPEYPDHIREV